MAFGQALLYEETFPYPGPSGNLPVAAAGWANRIPNNPQRLFQMSGADGAVYAFQASADVPVATLFFTTTALDSGTSGVAFPATDLSLVRGLRLSVDIRPSYDPDNVTSRFAVQLNGTDWFCEASALPVPTTLSSVFSTYTRLFNPAATNWNRLTLNTLNVTIGPVSSSNLSGTISGAGMVFQHTVDNGTHDFDNFRILADGGSLAAAQPVASQLSLAWVAGPQIRLQRAAVLNGPVWEDVANTLGRSAATLPMSEEKAFFRISPAGAPVDNSTNLVRNSGFEADGSPVSAPYQWATSGDTVADAVVAGGYAGGFSLQHSNSATYQVETSQLVTNLANGFYKLTARAKCSGGQNACYLSGNEKLTSLPPLYTNWTEMVVRGINVTNGQCLVRLYSDSAGSNWCRVDEINLIKDDIAYAFLKGGDVSELPRMEYYGGKFYDGAVQKDCLQIMKEHGCNIVRLRLYNDPGNPNYYPANQLDPLGWQNPARTLALAQRAKAKGMQILLTFHYSDYWSGNDNQYKPHEWEGLNFAALRTALSNFTSDFMMQMVSQGTPPEYVSLGNEMQGGILYPDGSYTNAAQLAQLLNAGYSAVKAASPSTKVVLHVNTPKTDLVTWFFDLMTTRGVNWDIIGCSYYPFWTGFTTEQARNQINAWQPRFNKPVLIMETGYNWNPTTCNGWPGQLSNNGPEFYPSTPLGQKNFLLKCFNDLKLVNNGQCLGDLYLGPSLHLRSGPGMAKRRAKCGRQHNPFRFHRPRAALARSVLS